MFLCGWLLIFIEGYRYLIIYNINNQGGGIAAPEILSTGPDQVVRACACGTLGQSGSGSHRQSRDRGTRSIDFHAHPTRLGLGRHLDAHVIIQVVKRNRVSGAIGFHFDSAAVQACCGRGVGVICQVGRQGVGSIQLLGRCPLLAQ